MPEQMTADELAAYDGETVLLIERAEATATEAEQEAESLKAKYTAAKKLAEHEAANVLALIRERKEGRGKRPEANLLDMLPEPTRWRDRHPSMIREDIGEAAYATVAGIGTLGELFHQVTAFDPAQGTPMGLSLNECHAIREAIQKIIDREAGDIAEAAKPPAELWREYPIAEWSRWGMTAKDIEKLAAGELKNETARFPIATVGDLSNFSTPTATGWQRHLTDIRGIGQAGADRITAAEEQFWGWWRGGGEAEFAASKGLGNANPAGPGSGDDGFGPGDGDTEAGPASDPGSGTETFSLAEAL